MRVLLNGQHADALGPVGWRFTTGVYPNVQLFQMDAGEAKKLIDGGGEITLTIEDKSNVVTIKKLFVIGEAPSSAPMYRTVKVADLRWKWSRALIASKYNIRRRTGDKTLLNEGLIQLAQTVDDFYFHPGSLNGGTVKWKPREVVEDILRQLKRVGEFDSEVKSNTDSLEVNDLELDDQGPEALSVGLRHLPGTTLWVNKDGKVLVQSAIDLREEEVIKQTGPEIKDYGHAGLVSYRLTRPKKIIVYFTREQELRFDSVAEGSDAVANDDTRFMENVLVVTDPFVTIGGARVNYGSWVTFEEIFPYWNQTKAISGAFDFSHDFIQAAFFEDNLYNVHVPWGDDSPQPIPIGRIHAIKTHYRQTYQISRRWMNRLFKILPVRAAILDTTTGQRGRAQAFSDHCVRISARYISKDPNKQQLFKNVAGYASFLKDGNVSPALVQVLDDEVGIVRLDYQVDPYGEIKEIYPSQLINIPTANLADANPRGLGMRVGKFGNFPKLSANHRAAVVLTGVPAYPNDLGQFFPVTVTPDEVKDKVPGLKIDPADGPIWEVHVAPGRITARMAWSDADADNITRSFDLRGGAALQNAAFDVTNLTHLVVNYNDLKATARAVAAAIWSKMTDRYIGEKTVRTDPNVEIKGAIESIEYSTESDGKSITRITLPEELKEREPMALLPDGVRRTIFREVIP